MMKLRSPTNEPTYSSNSLVIRTMKIIDADGVTRTNSESQDEFDPAKMDVQNKAYEGQTDGPMNENKLSTELAHFCDYKLNISDLENGGGENGAQGR